MLALNILAIALLSVLSIAEDNQEAGMGHGTIAANSDDNGSMNECANAYEGTHHFHRFAKWMNEKNSSHYSPIHPEFQPAVHHLDLALIQHNAPITSGGDNCKFKHLDKVRNNAHVPLRDRALCSFEYILNYNAKRMPAAITEVKCTCSRPSPRVIGNHLYECEPLHYDQRVLLFDEDCRDFVPTVQSFVWGCIPVVQRWKSGNGNAEIMIDSLLSDVDY